MGTGTVLTASDDEVRAGLREAAKAKHIAQFREAQWVREADGRGLPRRDGATSTVTWLREVLNVSPGEAKRMVTLASTLDSGEVAATAAAFARGEINAEQVTLIADTVKDLRAQSIDWETIGKAEATLIGYAAEFDPVPLSKIAAVIVELVAPEVAQARLGRQLAAAEARALRDRFLTLRPNGSSQVRLSGLLTAEAAAIVTAALDPLCNPARRADNSAARLAGTGAVDAAGGNASTGHTACDDNSGRDAAGDATGGCNGAGVESGDADDRTPGQRRADALVEVCQLALHAGQLPDNGGERAQVVVTVDFDDLRERTGAGHLDNGQTLTPETVRQMACNASLIPAVLNTAGQVLDLGRERRLFTGPIRRALVLRDKGCCFPGCDRPAKWCDGHHIRHWADGGETCLSNAVLVCGWHHRLLHHSDWMVFIAADGRPTFIPPAHIDPHRTPRRNKYWPRT